MRKNSFTIKSFCNKKGQFAIEAVLLMTVLMGIFVAVVQVAKKEQFGRKLVQGPIKSVARMAAYGTWNEKCVAQGKTNPVSSPGKCHPNSMSRALSSYPR